MNILSLVCTHDIGFQSIGDDDNDDDDDDDDNDDENVTRIPPGQVLFWYYVLKLIFGINCWNYFLLLGGVRPPTP